MAKADDSEKEMDIASDAYILYVPCGYHILVDRNLACGSFSYHELTHATQENVQKAIENICPANLTSHNPIETLGEEEIYLPRVFGFLSGVASSSVGVGTSVRCQKVHASFSDLHPTLRFLGTRAAILWSIASPLLPLSAIQEELGASSSHLQFRSTKFRVLNT